MTPGLSTNAMPPPKSVAVLFCSKTASLAAATPLSSSGAFHVLTDMVPTGQTALSAIPELCSPAVGRTVMVDPVTLSTVPSGIWLMNRPPPDPAVLLRMVAVDTTNEMVALLPAMPPPSAGATPTIRIQVLRGALNSDTQVFSDLPCEDEQHNLLRAVFRVKVDPMTVCRSLSVMKRPPPRLVAVLVVKVESVTVRKSNLHAHTASVLHSIALQDERRVVQHLHATCCCRQRVVHDHRGNQLNGAPLSKHSTAIIHSCAVGELAALNSKAAAAAHTGAIQRAASST